MSLPIGVAERELAGVIRAGSLLSGDTPQPVPAVADWAALVNNAREHSVVGLLYRSLMRSGAIAAAPDDVRNKLRFAYIRTLASNTHKLGVFAELAGDLAARGVPVIALKGCALATTLYADAGQRMIGDIDFLVRSDDIPTTVEVVAQHGFQPYESVFNDDTRDAQLGELVFSRPGTPRISVEPHWHIFNQTYFVRHVSVDWFWSKTEPAQIGGQPALILNPDAQIIHLCSHYVVHHIAKPHLRWSYDIALLLARHGDCINWPAVIDAARQFDLFGVVQQVLAYVMDLWDVKLAPEQHALLFGAKPTTRERLITRAMNAEPVRPIIDGLMAGGLSSRLQYWRDVFFPSEAYMRMRYQNEVRGPLIIFYMRRLRNGVRRFMGMDL